MTKIPILKFWSIFAPPLHPVTKNLTIHYKQKSECTQFSTGLSTERIQKIIKEDLKLKSKEQLFKNELKAMRTFESAFGKMV